MHIQLVEYLAVNLSRIKMVNFGSHNESADIACTFPEKLIFY